MLDFVPKLSCSYCEQSVIIDQEKYLDDKVVDYHSFLIFNIYPDFHWSYEVIPCKNDPEKCYVHVACPKCVDGLEYYKNGSLTIDGWLEVCKQYNTEDEQEND